MVLGSKKERSYEFTHIKDFEANDELTVTAIAQ